METLRTMFRVVVMLVALVIAYKGWQLYGPSVDRLKSFALRVIEIAQSALHETGQPGNGTSNRATDQEAAPFAVLAEDASGQVLQAQALVPSSELPATNSAPDAFAPPALAKAAPAAAQTVDRTAAPDRELLTLYSRLEKLGAHDPRLAAWGSGGQLYRFCCQAAVRDTSSFQRHFEAIAAEPRLAVQEVVAKVEAWRAAQHETAHLGTMLR